MPTPTFLRLLPALLAAALLATACGGGGGDRLELVDPPPSARFGPSSSFANICTLEGQKRFVRSYLDEAYLWYDEIRDVDASRYDSVRDYFNALLVRTRDDNGMPRDRYSAILPAAQASALATQDFASGPAADQPQPQADGTGSVREAKVVTTPGARRAGYIQFNDHDSGAQDALISAVGQLRDAGVRELVLDLRFNSGGFVYVAATAASLIAGPAASGRIFEQLRFNDKRQARSDASTLFFSSKVEYAEREYAPGTPLPQLDLPRVYVLTSGATCSSSESIINGLRGIDLEVVQIGGTTCGKPYGFTRKDNCGLALFPVEFQGYNAKEFGDYTAGFAPTCPVADNPRASAGSASDPLLAAALHHIDHGSCPPASGPLLLQSAQPDTGAQPARPAWAGRLLGPLR